MQISKNKIVTNGINGESQVNGNGNVNGKKEPSTYSVTTFGIQQSSGKAAVDSGSHTGMSSG